MFAIVLLLPQVKKLQQAYATWNDAYQLYNYNLYTECLDDYEKALSLLQHNGEFLINYGKALSMAEKHPEAFEILNRAKAYISNTVLYSAMGDSHKAIAMANTILNKEVKVHSTAIDEIKEEMKTIITK